jgi:acyl carrier protein
MPNPADEMQKGPGRCPACGATVHQGRWERHWEQYGEIPCPHCGTALWFASRRDGLWLHEAAKVAPVRQRVLGIVAENLGIDLEQLKDSTSFMPDVGADTLDVVEFVMEVEKAFQLTIPDKEAEFLMTVGDLIDYLMRQLHGR